MKRRTIAVVLSVSVLLNLIAIPLLAWQLAGYSMMYRRNVDYAAELAYAVGYHRALGNNLATELASYPTRLQITKADSDLVEAVIWPAKEQVLVLEFSDPKICNASIGDIPGYRELSAFSDPKICNASIGEPDGAANGSQPIRSETNSTSSAADSRR